MLHFSAIAVNVNLRLRVALFFFLHFWRKGDVIFTFGFTVFAVPVT